MILDKLSSSEHWRPLLLLTPSIYLHALQAYIYYKLNYVALNMHCRPMYKLFSFQHANAMLTAHILGLWP